jgi:uncharacterized membrane protein YfcA
MPLLGVLAGLVTTVAGLGGGMLLLLLLAAWWGDPVRAIAVATPALLVGNAHRAFLFRRELPGPVAARFAGGALAGALVGGALALAVPAWAVQAAMVGATVLAVAQHLTGRVPRPPAGLLVPAGGLVGLSSTAGGAGLLAGPVLQAAGLHGGAYLATLSVSALAMHVGRLLALGAGGAMTADVWRDALLLAVGIPIGNTLGRLARTRASELALHRAELATAAALVALSVAGVLR